MYDNLHCNSTGVHNLLKSHCKFIFYRWNQHIRKTDERDKAVGKVVDMVKETIKVYQRAVPHKMAYISSLDSKCMFL